MLGDIYSRSKLKLIVRINIDRHSSMGQIVRLSDDYCWEQRGRRVSKLRMEISRIRSQVKMKFLTV